MDSRPADEKPLRSISGYEIVAWLKPEAGRPRLLNAEGVWRSMGGKGITLMCLANANACGTGELVMRTLPPVRVPGD